MESGAQRYQGSERTGSVRLCSLFWTDSSWLVETYVRM